MKIAIVFPLESIDSKDTKKVDQLVYGGAEKLYDEMLTNFNKYSKEEFELLGIQCNLQNFEGIIEAYKNFFELNLENYDLVISTKTGSWMVQAKKKILYLQHPQRGLYELYNPKINIKTKFEKIFEKNKSLQEIKLITQGEEYTRKKAEKLFDLLEKNKSQIKKLNLNFLESPLLVEVIKFLDRVGISECERKFAQSNTIKNRQGYFHKDEIKEVKVLYPPLTESYSCNNYGNLIFTASRLEKLKRIDLIIKSFKKLKMKNIKLKIAGLGGEWGNLKKLIGKDKRIELLGFVEEKRLKDYYSKCLFVPFVPFDEDFGFVTLEAMKSKKAVLTCEDSGGPAELVRENFNGKTAKTTVADLSKKMKEMIKDKKATIQMGKNAFDSIKKINWKNFVEEMGFEKNKEKIQKSIKKDKSKINENIVLVNTYSMEPTISGGRIRIKELFSELSKNYKITIINLVMPKDNEKVNIINKNLIEYNLPLCNKVKENIEKTNKKIKIPIDDIYISNLENKKKYIKTLKKYCNKNTIIICQHPYMFNYIKGVPKKYLIYEAHNNEYLLKKSLFGNTKRTSPYLNQVYKLERNLCKNAKYIISVSEEEKNSLSKIYKINKNKIKIIPNGVNYLEAQQSKSYERENLKKELGIKSKGTGIFLGSYHKPNLQALLKIIEMAKKNKGITFFIIGSVIYNYLETHNEALPKNIIAFGKINDFEKKILIKTSDFAINPMFSGAGSNLKIIEYMASGLPIITTKLGTRGLKPSKIDVLLMNKQTTKIDIQRLKLQDTERNRKYVQNNFDWKNLARQYKEILQNAKPAR